MKITVLLAALCLSGCANMTPSESDILDVAAGAAVIGAAIAEPLPDTDDHRHWCEQNRDHEHCQGDRK